MRKDEARESWADEAEQMLRRRDLEAVIGVGQSALRQLENMVKDGWKKETPEESEELKALRRELEALREENRRLQLENFWLTGHRGKGQET